MAEVEVAVEAVVPVGAVVLGHLLGEVPNASLTVAAEPAMFT
jgi:hypothetical protein